jgi:hypothetical protein
MKYRLAFISVALLALAGCASKSNTEGLKPHQYTMHLTEPVNNANGLSCIHVTEQVVLEQYESEVGDRIFMPKTYREMKLAICDGGSIPLNRDLIRGTVFERPEVSHAVQ